MPAGKHLPSTHCMRNNHPSVQQIQSSQEALSVWNETKPKAR